MKQGRVEPDARLEQPVMPAGWVLHEFKNLLAAILVNAEFLRRDAVDPVVVHEVADEILLASGRARELLEQVVGHARFIDEGGRSLLDLSALTRERGRADVAARVVARARESLDFTGHCVLVIDHDDLFRSVTYRTLRARGFEVLTARDGLEGREIFAGQHARIDAVLVEIGMPHERGHDVLDELRRIDSTVPVVFVSGQTEHELREREIFGLAEGLVLKPFRDDELLDALIRVIVHRGRA